MTRGNAVVLIVLLLIGVGPLPGWAADLADTKAAMRSFFAELDYLPIIVPADEKVGDVYRLSGWRLIDRAEKCFPELDAPARVRSVLPRLVQTAEADAGISAWIASLFKAEASGEMSDRVVIEYRDVQKGQASENDLRAALSADCPGIQAELSCRFDECADPREAPLVLGTVLYARKLVFLGVSRSVKASVEADVGALVSSLVPGRRTEVLDAEAAARAGFGQTSGVLIDSDELVPVAFQPAFVPLAAFDVHRGKGGKATETRLIGVERWARFDPDDARHRNIVLKLLELETQD